jgi:hypothetical protein
MIAAWTNGGSSTWSSMPRSGTEVADVELGGGTDLGRGRGRWMEHGRDGRCEAAEGGVRSRAETHSALSEEVTRVRYKASSRLIRVSSGRTNDL